MWEVGRGALQRLISAATFAQTVDHKLGLALHEDKLASFSLSPSWRRALQDYAELIGPCTTSPVLLGVQYCVGGRQICVPEGKVTAAVAKRCRRIALAARFSWMRRALVELVVISLFRWTGPWATYRAEVLKKWASSIEWALWGRKPPRGRDAFLLWQVYGRPRHQPVFALHFAALRFQWVAWSKDSQFPEAPRFRAALQFFGWTVDGEF